MTHRPRLLWSHDVEGRQLGQVFFAKDGASVEFIAYEVENELFSVDYYPRAVILSPEGKVVSEVSGGEGFSTGLGSDDSERSGWPQSIHDHGRLSAHFTNGKLQIWDRGRCRRRLQVPPRWQAGNARWAPSGQRIAVLALYASWHPRPGQLCRVWQLDQRGRLAEIHVSRGEVGPVAWSNDEQQLAVPGDGSVALIDLEQNSSRTIDVPLPHPNAPVWLPDGRLLVRDGPTIAWIDPDSGDVDVWTRKMAQPIDEDLSPDRRALFSTCGRRGLRIWDLASRSMVLTTQLSQPERHRPTARAWSPDGRYLAVSCRALRVWDARSGERVLHLPAEEVQGEIHSLTWAPDGHRLLTIGSDKVARMWDAPTGEQFLQWAPFRHQSQSAAFSPDGNRLVTADATDYSRVGRVQLWALSPEHNRSS